MKKVYLSILSIAALSGSFAQKNYEPQTLNFSTVQEDQSGKNKPALVGEKTLGDVWTNDFSVPGDWVIDNDGQTAAGFGWDIGATESSWKWTSVINSTSDGNFAELGNGNPTANPATQAQNVTYTLTTFAAIPVTSPQVTLSFLQYGAHFRDAQEVYISTDGGTVWQLVGTNSNIPILSTTGGAAYTNPTLKSINLANFIGAASSILVRFSWTTDVTASTSANDWVTYGWMIDDVNITTNPTDDLTQNSVMWGTAGPWGGLLPYYKTPISQISPMDFGGIITNNGINNQTDVLFHATATGYAGASLPTALASGILDTIWVDNQFTPPATVGSTTMSFNTDMSATDANTADNATFAPVTFSITDNLYARDSGTKTGTSSNAGLTFEVGNIFDIFTDVTLFSADVTLDNTTTTGSVIYGILYDVSGADFLEITRTDDHVVTSTQKNVNLSLEFSGGVDLTGGTSYLLAIGTLGGQAPNDLVVQTAGTSEKQTSFYKDETDTWFYTTGTPKVRMNFADGSGINELSNNVGLAIYPNPATAQANVSFNLKAEANVVISITDLTGKTVYTNDLGATTSGAHKVTVNTDALSNGVYMVNVNSNGTVSTQKLVVRK